jgi:hypothetical protein
VDKLAIDGVLNPLGGKYRSSEQIRAQHVVNTLRAALAKADEKAKKAAMVTPAAAAAAAAAADAATSKSAARPPPLAARPEIAATAGGQPGPRRVVQDADSVDDVADDDEKESK